MVCFPYLKRLCAKIDVDQAAALLLCSYEAAHAAGVLDDRMVFLHAAAEVHDHYFFTERWSLADSPGIAAAAGDALSAASITLDDVSRFDLYSCFPSAVQVAVRALDLGRRGFPSADRHRRARLRRRTGEQLSDARDRAHGRSASRRPDQLRLHDRARLVHLEARRGRVVGVAAGARFPARRSRDEPGPGRRPAAPGTRRDDRRNRDARSNVGRRSKRDGTPVVGHRHRAHRRRPAGRWRTSETTPSCRGPHRPTPMKKAAHRAAFTNDGTTNTAHL